MRVVVHTIPGEDPVRHIPGIAGTLDFQTLCGSCWDDGVFEEEESDDIDCHACADVVQSLFREYTLRDLRKIRDGSYYHR